MKKVKKIVITLKEKEGNISLDKETTLTDLARCYMLFEEILYHNFSEEYILAALDGVKKTTQNIEEVKNENDD